MGKVKLRRGEVEVGGDRMYLCSHLIVIWFCNNFVIKKISDFLILLWFLYNRFIYQVEMKRNIDLIGTFSFFGTTRNRCERGTPCIFICTFICICICICSICRTNIFVRYSKLRRGEVGTLCINSFIKFRRFSSPLSLSWKIPETKCFEQFTTKRFLLLIL